ncbi:MAG: hypothetical protein H6735_04965 [Alphaproteobacteria bacterium]|nr:hypothetical protein [Alphaproteobacteria bacterium]
MELALTRAFGLSPEEAHVRARGTDMVVGTRAEAQQAVALLRAGGVAAALVDATAVRS